MAKFDPEDLIKWEELAPSLQKRFKDIWDAINKLDKRISDVELLLNGVRLTIAYSPPASPIADKEIYVDLNTNYIYKYDTANGPLGWTGIFAVRSNLTYNIPTSDVGGNIWID